MGVHTMSSAHMTADPLEVTRHGAIMDGFDLDGGGLAPEFRGLESGRDRPAMSPVEEQQEEGNVSELQLELERTGGDFRQDETLSERADPEAFLVGTGGLAPRDHQVVAVCRLVGLVRMDHKTNVRPINYLVQHATGSGKSLTMAALAVSLLQMRTQGTTKPLFAMVIFLTDRKNLDKQLGDTVEAFMNRHNILLFRATSTAELAGALSAPADQRPVAIMSTLQKFPCLQSDVQAVQRVLDSGKIAIIVDEAHRGHGHSSSASINQILGGRASQPPGVVYFGFTATPSAHALTLFGLRRMRQDGGAEYVPAHTYSMQDALRDGRVLNPLQHYTCVNIALDVQKEQGGLKSGLNMKTLQNLSGKSFDFASYCRVLDAAVNNAAVLKSKANFIAKHFLGCIETRACSREGSDFRPRAMVVCRSRAHVTSLTLALREAGGEDLSVYGAMSGDLSLEDGDGGAVVWTEASLNAGAATLDDADLLVVCNKLETGFDEPRLAVMYVDRKLQGARCVQVLSRINRTADGKAATRVVDFVNTAQAIRASFQEFWGECVNSGGSAGAEARAVADLDACVGRLLALSGGSLAGLSADEAAVVLSSACDGAEGRRELAADLAQCVQLCQQLNIQKYELPLSFAVQLHKVVSSWKSDVGGSAPSSDVMNLKFGVASMSEVHSGEIRVSELRADVSAKDLGFVPLGGKFQSNNQLRSSCQTLRDHVRLTLNALSSSEVVRHVAALNAQLKAALASGDDALCVLLLQKLDVLNVTLDMLKDTGVGVTVRKAAKVLRRSVATLAGSLVREWKKLLSATAPLPLPQQLLSYPEAQHLHENAPRDALIVKLLEALSQEPNETAVKRPSETDGPQESNKRAKMAESTSSSRPDESAGSALPTAAGEGKLPQTLSRSCSPLPRSCSPLFRSCSPETPQSDDETTRGHDHKAKHRKQGALQIARAIELQIAVQSIQGRGGKVWYNGKARKLLYNLRDVENSELRERVLSSELTPTRLVQAEASEIANDKLKRQRKQVKEEVMTQIVEGLDTGKALLAPNSEDHKCPACGSSACHVTVGQTGGWISSEKETKVSVTCCTCGKEFGDGEA